MRTSIYVLSCAFLALAITACNGVEVRPADVETFTAENYHYYSWRSEPLKNTASSRDPLYRLDPLLRDAINAALQKKGYKEDAARAQFSVDYIFAEGIRDGVKGAEASNLTTHPGIAPDRDIDQASIDNAYALGGLKETRNIGIQLNDIERNIEVWRVIITKLVEDANTAPNSSLAKSVNSAIAQGIKPLPAAQ
jgi:hypothetical protein